MKKMRYRIFRNIKLGLIGCLLLTLSSCKNEILLENDSTLNSATESEKKMDEIENQGENTGHLQLSKKIVVTEEGDSIVNFKLFENSDFELGVYLPEKDWKASFDENEMTISYANIGHISIIIYDGVDSEYYETYKEKFEVMGETLNTISAPDWTEHSSEIIDWDNEIHKFSAFGVIDERNVIVSYEFNTSYVEEYLPYLEIIRKEIYWRIDQSRFYPGFRLIDPETKYSEVDNNSLSKNSLVFMDQYDIGNAIPFYTIGKEKASIVGCLINGEIIGIEQLFSKNVYGTPLPEDVYIPFAEVGDELSIYNANGLIGETIIKNTSYFISDSSGGINLVAMHEPINENIEFNTSTSAVFALPKDSNIQVIETIYDWDNNSYRFDIDDDDIEEIISFEEYESGIEENPIRLRMNFTKGSHTEPVDSASFFNEEESSGFIITKLPDETICIITRDTAYDYISYSGVNFYILSDSKFRHVAWYSY